MLKIFEKIFDANKKELERLKPIVDKINSFEDEVQQYKDEQFKEKTAELKTRISSDETLDDILPEAFALVREAAKRTIGERPFDVQLMAAIALHQGKVAEQKTGEGKTLSASLPLYLNSLTGRGVHLVTVNDYLSKVGAGWMGPVYHLLGVSVSAIIHDYSFIYDPAYEDKDVLDWRLRYLRPISRKEAYLTDITYGINSEFGFDYLRDNMVSNFEQMKQREHHYAIVDEVDSVLIDEARTPHIISAPDMEPTQKYYDYAKLIEKLNPATDYQIDEKLRTASLTEHGILKVEKLLGVENLYEKDFQTIHHIEAALKAKTLFKREKDYIVKDNQVIIVDEFTGRLLYGRRYSEGLHQAIEAKEGVTIQQESKTLATISLQNYFRMYQKLAGMTGTAATEAEELNKIYSLDVLVVPTHKPMIRKDNPDSIFKTMRAKYAAVAREVEEKYKKGQPVLVGTTSIENNQIVSALLTHKGITHKVLNAKNHTQEAVIIAQAGQRSAITVATNMAGRGVDIILGGMSPNKYIIQDKNEYEEKQKLWQKNHQEVIQLGGLHVIGTERHDSRRIDNQLRGRSGRQGDPGSSRFFVSLEDDMMRLFGGEQIASLMTRFNLPEDQPLEHSMVSKAIEQAQVKVEGFNFDARKHLVEYDDVLNKQREIIYNRRKKVLEIVAQTKVIDAKNGEQKESVATNTLKGEILEKVQNFISNIVSMYTAEGFSKEEIKKIVREFCIVIPFDQDSQKKLVEQLEKLETEDRISSSLTDISVNIYNQREKNFGSDIIRQIEQWLVLSAIDTHWMNHLDALDDLREGIGLRGYGQRDPLVEYKNEAYMLFERLLTNIDDDIIHRIYRIEVQQTPSEISPLVQAAARAQANIDAGQQGIGQVSHAVQHAQQPLQDASLQTLPQTTQPIRKVKKIGRNDSCWCGSGKKYKKCHLHIAPQGSEEERLFTLYFNDVENWEKTTGRKIKR